MYSDIQPRGVIQYSIDPEQFDEPIERQYEQFYTTEIEARHDAKELANKLRVSVEIEVADRWGMYGRYYLESMQMDILHFTKFECRWILSIQPNWSNTCFPSLNCKCS